MPQDGADIFRVLEVFRILPAASSWTSSAGTSDVLVIVIPTAVAIAAVGVLVAWVKRRGAK